MRLQDLLDDLACWNVCQTEVTPAGYEAKDSPALAVARRVAALWRVCGVCEGKSVERLTPGEWGTLCSRCEGTGAVAVADKMRRLLIDPHAYLFKEER